MEISCSRCHQSLEADATYCAACGLPQLVYQVDVSAGSDQPERYNEPVRDAASVDWKTALHSALVLSIPAGIVCAILYQYSILYQSGLFGLLLLMAAAGAWVVAFYLRSQRPARITVGAGARIGLATGLLSAWTAAATTGLALYAARYWFHSGKVFDNFWQTIVNTQMTQEWNSTGADPQTISLLKTWLLSPQGRAGWALAAIGFLMVALLLFAVAGGAIGARFLARPRRPQA